MTTTINEPKQTGPRTVAGKAVSSRNALKHGVYSNARILGDEDPAEFERLSAEYYQHFRPDNPVERKLVDDLVQGEWLLRRLNRIDAEILESGMKPLFSGRIPNCGEAFASAGQVELRLQRRIDSTDRLYSRNLEKLRQLQKERTLNPPPDHDPAAKPEPMPYPNPVESVPQEPDDFVSSQPVVEPPAPAEKRPRLTIPQLKTIVLNALNDNLPAGEPPITEDPQSWVR